jgi:hypothetical protein
MQFFKASEKQILKTFVLRRFFEQTLTQIPKTKIFNDKFSIFYRI